MARLTPEPTQKGGSPAKDAWVVCGPSKPDSCVSCSHLVQLVPVALRGHELSHQPQDPVAPTRTLRNRPYLAMGVLRGSDGGVYRGRCRRHIRDRTTVVAVWAKAITRRALETPSSMPRRTSPSAKANYSRCLLDQERDHCGLNPNDSPSTKSGQIQLSRCRLVFVCSQQPDPNNCDCDHC